MISILVLDHAVRCPICGMETRRLVQAGDGGQARCPACQDVASRAEDLLRPQPSPAQGPSAQAQSAQAQSAQARLITNGR